MKNKIFNFVLDLFKNGDEEEPAGIFARECKLNCVKLQ